MGDDWSSYSLTKDGFDITYQVNYLSACYLTMLLMPVLQDTSLQTYPVPSRIVNLASVMHRYVRKSPAKKVLRGFNKTAPDLSAIKDAEKAKAQLDVEFMKKSYLYSKLGNILFSYECQKRFALPSSSSSSDERRPSVISIAANPGS